MNTALQKNISLYLSDKNMSVNALEKQAGLKPSAIQNIVHGRSKNPSLHSIYAIANVLGCTVEDLMRENNPSPSYSKEEAQTPWNFELYMDSVRVVNDLFKKYEIEAPKETVLPYIDEVYSYSTRKSQRTADKTFAEWCVESWLLKKRNRSFLK